MLHMWCTGVVTIDVAHIGNEIHLFYSLLVSLYVVISSILPFMKNVGVSLLSRIHNRKRKSIQPSQYSVQMHCVKFVP